MTTFWLFPFNKYISGNVSQGSEITRTDNTSKLTLKVLERVFISNANSEIFQKPFKWSFPALLECLDHGAGASVRVQQPDGMSNIQMQTESDRTQKYLS